ncbi:MAG TPA: Asp-tRNA(Asn)/Glu-tRNA(Gln) amidotransferase subunit GatB [Acidobacteriota bacterium]|nr:Asp-tRNA(Asn)/Glu-tRNA(Gln) amidotransferase subunit GatB [Acidobacteriota bacterium]
MNFDSVIGLEVHAQLMTETKIFCGCRTVFGSGPNENTCPVCLGLPGALPVLNRRAVELAVRAAIALQCSIPPASIFARKNYFYPDLPKGYQISQFDRPLAENGKLRIRTGKESRVVRIKRLHMEEDAGKLVHEGVESCTEASYVDLNRSGVPLIEIVTEPDLESPAEAYAYLTELKAILQYTDVSPANMEEGNLRCDANISLRPEGSSGLGTKVEIKNLNSFKNVQKALEYEISRQSRILSGGSNIAQETRLFDADRGITEAMRSKEEAHDYRYFPDPDLPPCEVSPGLYRTMEASLPELPALKRERFQTEYGLALMEAQVLSEDRGRAQRFEEAARLSGNPKQAANWILRAPEASVRPADIAGLIDLVDRGAISSDQAKIVFTEMKDSGKSPAQIVSERGLTQVSGEEELGRLVATVLDTEPELVSRYRQGETRLLGVLVGLVMKASSGKANPAVVNRLIKERLSH